MELLESLYQRLVTDNSKVEESSLVARFKRFIKTPDKTPARGLYLWGGVVRGITYLMD